MLQMIIGLLVLATGGPAYATTVTGQVNCRSLANSANAVVSLVSLDQAETNFKPPEGDVIMDQYNLIFAPFVLPIMKGTRVAFPNSDEVRHNVFSPSKAKRFNLGTYPQGTVRHVVFDQPGVVALLCNVHHQMSAYIVVTETPFFAVTDVEGRFEIKDVPPGKYVLKTWHEKLPPTSREITVSDSSEALAVEIELED
jgi:plastocyanin